MREPKDEVFQFKIRVLKKMGWLTGIEPATTGITILGSTN